MRLTKDQTEQNRRRIVEVAAKLFRLRGIENVSVSDVMAEAGFTHGGFYNHFASKEELAAEAVAKGFTDFTTELTGLITKAEDSSAAFRNALKGYVTASHRDAPGGGCPTAAFPVDAARHGEEVQAAFAEGIETYLSIIAPRLGGGRTKARKDATVLLSGMVGALVLSRAVQKASPKLSLELLHDMQQSIAQRVRDKSSS
jgi:TetR/AcrR family transcriptional regulator, transcriptional repressor for nem operon